MANVVFILGAGASKPSGAPLMANFLDVATDLYRTNQVQDKKEEFERVFRSIGGLQAVHSKAQLDLNNIESIFTALELGRIIQRVPGLDPEEIASSISALKKLIVNTLQVTIRFPARGAHILPPKPYDDFASLLRYLGEKAFPHQSAAVITFNYDIGVDLALYREGLGPNYVLESAPHANWPVDLLKLHGSLNWATEKESRRIRPVHLHDYLQRYTARAFDMDATVTMPIGSQLVEFFGRDPKVPVAVESDPVIVPPSWNKADYHQALSDVWAAAARHLAEAESIFIAGYSLPETDSFFRHLFALGCVGKAALRRLVVYNPDQSVDRRFRELLGPGAIARYSFEQCYFEDAIEKIQQFFPLQR